MTSLNGGVATTPPQVQQPRTTDALREARNAAVPEASIALLMLPKRRGLMIRKAEPVKGEPNKEGAGNRKGYMK